VWIEFYWDSSKVSMQVKLTQARIRTSGRLLVFLCLALLSFTATAQVLHSHPDQLAGTAKHCPICPVLHSVAPLTHSVQLDFSFHTTAYLTGCSNPQHHAVEALFALFSRPPPSLI